MLLYVERIFMDKKAMMSEQTKKALKDSFLELYAKKGISGVTVGAITKKAGYNRCTFYNYYTDVAEMLEEIENSVLAEIQERLSTQELQITNINDAFEQFLTFFEGYGNTIYVLLSKGADSGFRNRFKESAFAIYRKALAGKLDEEQIEYLITYVSSCGLGLVEHWYETGRKYSTDEFLRLVQSLLSTGVMGYMQGTMTPHK